MKREVRLAMLLPDMIERYEAIHDAIPAINLQHIRDQGIVLLEIYRMGTTLVMIVEHQEQAPVANRIIDEVAETNWQQVTGECFAEPWRDLDLIFAA